MKYSKLIMICLSFLFLIGSLTFLTINASLWTNIIVKFYFTWTVSSTLLLFLLGLIALSLIILLIKELLFQKRYLKSLMIQAIVFIIIGSLTSLFLILNRISSDVTLSWPAPLIPISEVIEIDNANKYNYYLAGVYSQKNLTKLEQLFVLLDPSYEFTLNDEFDQLTKQERYLGGMIAKKSSIQSALIASYHLANKPIDYQYLGHQVNFKYCFVSDELQIGDLILSVNNNPLTKESDLLEYLLPIITKAKNSNQISSTFVELQVKEISGLLKNVNINLHVANNQVMFGIGFFPVYEITSPVIASEKQYSASGPSGGLMMSLAIYNQLADKNLFKEYKISGTGTIDAFGNVGLIGGIKQKIITANNEQVDFFFIQKGGENEQEAMAINKLLHSKMKIIPVVTLGEAITYLEGLNE